VKEHSLAYTQSANWLPFRRRSGAPLVRRQHDPIRVALYGETGQISGRSLKRGKLMVLQCLMKMLLWTCHLGWHLLIIQSK
jgi:hypothetical protein